MDDSNLIDKLGGTGKVARMCKVSSEAVSQWRKDGIPDARLMYLKLLHPDAFNDAAVPDPSQEAA